jgi:type I restriction enzyme S subunit
MSREKKLIPALRFPEFMNEREWEEKSIGEIFNAFSGGTPSTSEKEYYGGEIQFIRSAEINKEETELFLTEEGLKNSSAKLVKKGDLLVALYGANSGDSAISKINGAINQAILCLQSEFSNSFTYNFLTLKKDRIVSRFIQGGQGNLSGDIVKSISIPFPQKTEQQKIASCLSSLDEVIEAHSQKLETLKAHKKGLMQNLFPQEDETVPKYRFAEFVNDEEWNVKDLSELGDLINGLTYSPDDVREKGLLVLRSSNIQNGLIDFNDCVYVRTDINGANISEPNDILVCVRNGSKNLIGKNAIIPKGIPLATHGAFMTVFRAKNPEFVFQLFQTDFYDKQVKADLGATINSINGKNFLKYEFPIPEKPKEQQKIADCFSSLDALITAQAEKVEQLKLHKKGLMQGLFPKINE